MRQCRGRPGFPTRRDWTPGACTHVDQSTRLDNEAMRRLPTAARNNGAPGPMPQTKSMRAAIASAAYGSTVHASSASGEPMSALMQAAQPCSSGRL